MAAAVGVARVDRAGEARRRAVACGAVGSLRELVEVRELERRRLVCARVVLAVLLRPVEGVVGETDQLVPSHALQRVRRDARAHRDRADALDLHAPHALDDRLRDLQSGMLVEAGEEDRELVAAKTEALAALAESRRDLGEDAVARGMAEAVVHLLEVVEVDEAEAERRSRPLGLRQL